MIGCDAEEIVFTSGGTEANNLAIKGVMLRHTPGDGHLIVSQIEHPAVSMPADFLCRLGYDVTVVPCDSNGIIQPEAIESAIRPETRLVSVMHANNEIGAVQPIAEIAKICQMRDVLMHTDASQTIGKIPAFIQELEVDLLTIAAHKFYGPKGVGALFVRRGLALESLLHGAGHENGFRAGTENTPYIVGLGQAAHLAANGLDESAVGMNRLRDRLEKQLRDSIPGLKVNGGSVSRLPNTLSVSFPGVGGREILQRVPELCASTGSACHSTGNVESVTLSAMGKDAGHIAGTVRLSCGWYTSQDEIDRAASLLIDAWENIYDVHSNLN
jgi:cysteine desulfurase